MPLLDLSPTELLATTRAVRKRLDLTRPVEPEVIRQCLELAVQAPTGANSQGWHFVIVTETEQRQALTAIYRKGWALYRERMRAGHRIPGPDLTPERMATLSKVLASAVYLDEHMHEVPVLVVPCIQGRAEGLPSAEQAGFWGSILPAIWSFMLAARARGLGTSLTTVHLYYESEAAEVLGIPYEQVTQAALIPMAYTLGTDFKPAPRIPLESVLHWDRW
jgi:nitroreductase